MIKLIAEAALLILHLMEYAIIGVVLISWIPQIKDTKFASILKMLTDPILIPMRNLQEKIMSGRSMMIDLSPLFAIVLINILEGIFGNLAQY